MQFSVVPSDGFSACFVQFLKRYEKCVVFNRDYFEGKGEQISSYPMYLCSYRLNPGTSLFSLICSGYSGGKVAGA